MATSSRKSKRKASEKSREVRGEALQEAIARRAYELYLARESNDGSDVDDWLQAEIELCGGNPAPE
jgi:hypothetical protein